MLTEKEKEDLLTKLLMDVTLHNQGDVITVPTQVMLNSSSTVNTEVSYISDTKGSKSHESVESCRSVKTFASEKTLASSFESVRSEKIDQRPKSVVSAKRVKSVEKSRTQAVCPLPPIVFKDGIGLEKKSNNASLSCLRSDVSVNMNDFDVGLNNIDIEIDDNLYHSRKYFSCMFLCQGIKYCNRVQ